MAEESAEYRKLYETLKGLASTSTTVSIKELLEPEEPKRQSKKEKQSKSALTASVITSLFGECKEELNESALPSAQELTCQACKKIFPTLQKVIAHRSDSLACKQCAALSVEEQECAITGSLPDLIQQWAKKAMGEKECPYCHQVFTTKKTHENHFASSTTCNRLAYHIFLNSV